MRTTNWLASNALRLRSLNYPNITVQIIGYIHFTGDIYCDPPWAVEASTREREAIPIAINACLAGQPLRITCWRDFENEVIEGIR